MKGRSPGSLASVLLGLFVLCAAWSSTSAASTSAANSIEDRDADIRQLMKTLLFYLRDRIQSSKAGMPFRLHVPGPKLGPQSGLIARPQHVHAVVGNPGPAEDLPSPDFEDPDRMDFHDSDKRQFDDYGHMRFGKRAQHFDDYGHMRFGRSLNSMTKSQPASSTSGNEDFQQGNQHAVNSFKSE